LNALTTPASRGQANGPDDGQAVLLIMGLAYPAAMWFRLMAVQLPPSTPRERIKEDWAVRLPLAATNRGYLARAMGTSQWDRYDRLDQITTPTLVVHGELDALVPPANGRILADRIPGAELVTVPRANHLLGTDQPELLVNWLDRHR
jgi:hypothetical protein